jgi:hypothetical protein
MAIDQDIKDSRTRALGGKTDLEWELYELEQAERIEYKTDVEEGSTFITVFTYACWIILFVVLLKIVF